LKTAVKEPTKQTSPRHDHLCKELSNRQHERFTIAESSRTNKASLEAFEQSVAKESIEKDTIFDEELMVTVLPTEWSLNQSPFQLIKKGNDWSTHHKRHTFHNQIVYPNFVTAIGGEVFGEWEHLWVKEAVNHANGLGYQRIDVSCAATIPSS
jgi:hypothetical protein